MTDDTDGVSIHAGFPNPASDRSLATVDLHRLLVKQPVSTFFMTIEGDEWEEKSIFAGDIIVIDRAVEPRKKDLVIITKAADFLITPFHKLPDDCTFWGTVTAVIHRFRS